MSQTVVGILAANPALSSILAMVLGGDTRLSIRQFANEDELFGYLYAAPIDILICDFDRAGRPAYEMVEAIRLDNHIPSRDAQVIGLSRTITPPMRQQTISAGIDEVILKPASPRYLLQRVQARIAPRPAVSSPSGYRGPDRRNRMPFPTPQPNPKRRQEDNVVTLFPEGSERG